MPALTDFLVALPVLGIAAIIDRPGYVKRYREKYDGQPWLMDKTALAVLIERAAKYADARDRRLRVFFEQCGKSEDRALIACIKSLKTDGSPFVSDTSDKYDGLSAADFKRIVLGDARRRTKAAAPIQIADLYLYPMAKGGYDPTYKPYVQLMDANRIIDSILPAADRDKLGVKYSCFEDIKSKKT